MCELRVDTATDAGQARSTKGRGRLGELQTTNGHSSEFTDIQPNLDIMERCILMIPSRLELVGLPRWTDSSGIIGALAGASVLDGFPWDVSCDSDGLKRPFWSVLPLSR